MLRITRSSEEDESETTLKVEGELVADCVGLLERECSVAVAMGRPLRLDISHLTNVDWRGVRLLRSLSRRGIAFANCTPVMAEILAEEEGR